MARHARKGAVFMDSSNELFAYISVDQDGKDGLMAYFSIERAEWVPMVGINIDRMKALRKTADDISRIRQIPYKLVRYKKYQEEFVAPGKPLPGDSRIKEIISAALKFIGGKNGQASDQGN